MDSVTPEGEKDRPTTDSKWTLPPPSIQGVEVFESKNLLTRSGSTTEIFRKDWTSNKYEIRHMISVRFLPKIVSAWHRHEYQFDHFSVIDGFFKLVLYDGRDSSNTYEAVDVFKLSNLRPQTVKIPPGIWHGIQNVGPSEGLVLNFFNQEYNYQNPDEWRLPADTLEIPYEFL